MSTQPLFTRQFVAVCIVAVVTFVSFQTLTPTLPQYVVAIGASASGVGFVMGSFSLAAVFGRPLIGRAVDVTGTRRIPIMAGTVLFVLSPLAYLGLHDIWTLVPVRIAHGLGLAAFYTAASTLATDLIPDTRRTEGLAWFSMSVYLAIPAGAALGEYLLGPGGRHDPSDFVAPFVASAAIGALALVLTVLLPADERTGRRFRDVRGSGALVQRDALMPAAVLALGAVGFAAVVAFIVLYARELGIANTMLVFGVLGVSVVAVRGTVGPRADRVGPARLVPASAVVCAAAMVTLSAARSLPWLLAGAGLFGVGFGAMFPLLMAHAVNKAPDDQRGSALGLLTAALDVGIGGGSFILGGVIDLLGGGVRGFRGMYLAAGVAAVAAGVVFWGAERRRHALTGTGAIRSGT